MFQLGRYLSFHLNYLLCAYCDGNVRQRIIHHVFVYLSSFEIQQNSLNRSFCSVGVCSTTKKKLIASVSIVKIQLTNCLYRSICCVNKMVYGFKTVILMVQLQTVVMAIEGIVAQIGCFLFFLFMHPTKGAIWLLHKLQFSKKENE